MTVRKILLSLLFAIAFNLHGSSFEFHPCISILGNYTVTKNNTNINAGEFNIQNRRLNFGFELTNKFKIVGNYFIKAGLRYNQYQTTINGENPIPQLFDKPYPLSWRMGYDAISVPLEFGKQFVTSKGNSGDFFIGMSAGVLITSYAKYEVANDLPRNINYADTISSEILVSDINLPSYFFLTIDLGATYQPFKAIPGFSTGILCSIGLNRTSSSSYEGIIQNNSKGIEYKYNIQHQQRIINCALSLNYLFGEHRQRPSKKKGTYYHYH